MGAACQAPTDRARGPRATIRADVLDSSVGSRRQPPVPVDGRHRPELASLPAGLPDVDELFTFARDAELRFETLRMRIEECGGHGPRRAPDVLEVALRHPGDARVTTTEPSRGTAANYELWLSDGDDRPDLLGAHKLGTERPVRQTVVRPATTRDLPGHVAGLRPADGAADGDAPGHVRPSRRLLPERAGDRRAAGCRARTDVAGREAVVLDCDHPRTIEIWPPTGPTITIQVVVRPRDRLILRLVETIGGAVTRDADGRRLRPDAPLPPSAFDFSFPTGTTMLY